MNFYLTSHERLAGTWQYAQFGWLVMRATQRVACRLVLITSVWLTTTCTLLAQSGGGQSQSAMANTSTSLSTTAPLISLTKIPPGTLVVDEQAAAWNRVVLLATPRIASGDTDKLSTAVRSSVSKLTLCILATVNSDSSGSGAGAYRLQDVGLSYGALIQGKLKAVSTESAARLGAQLDFYSRQMLSENEKQIATVRLVLRTPTLAIFDAPTILFRDGQHKDFTTRHLVWIDPGSGKMAIVVWLLRADSNGQFQVAESTLRIVAPGTREDRKIHVDGRSFFLSIPSARAFALEDMPPGRDVQWNDEAKTLAARKTYDEQSIRDFAAVLNRLLTSSANKSGPP